MKNNILIVVAFLSLFFLYSCSEPANGQVIVEDMDCETEQLNLDELNGALKEENPYWKYEMLLVAQESAEEWVRENCN